MSVIGEILAIASRLAWFCVVALFAVATYAISNSGCSQLAYVDHGRRPGKHWAPRRPLARSQTPAAGLRPLLKPGVD